MAPEQARDAHARGRPGRRVRPRLHAVLRPHRAGPVRRPGGGRVRPARRRPGAAAAGGAAGLDAALEPDDGADAGRTATRRPRRVMRALLPYLPTAPRPSAAVAVPAARDGVYAAPAPAVRLARPTAPAAGNRVLIVDDQPDIRRLCRHRADRRGVRRATRPAPARTPSPPPPPAPTTSCCSTWTCPGSAARRCSAASAGTRRRAHLKVRHVLRQLVAATSSPASCSPGPTTSSPSRSASSSCGPGEVRPAAQGRPGPLRPAQPPSCSR